MRNVDVLFLIEHVTRELDVVLCLIHKLRSRFGLTAEVRNYYQDFADTLTQVMPRVVVFPFFYGSDHIYPVEYTRTWPTACFVNLGWEQILNKTDLSMKIPRDDVARLQVIHVCWTHKHAEFLEEYGVPANHRLLTGNPVMKLYDPPYNRYFKSRADLSALYDLDSRKKWVVFPESYQFAFFNEEFLRFLADHQNANMKLMRQAREYSERSLKKLFVWCDELREEDPIFIVRPRPSTGESQMIDFMRQSIRGTNSNIKIIKAETVREWILASDHVISSHSTTLVEAALAGKPIHRFSPETYPEALALHWHELVPLLSARTDLLEAIRSQPVNQGDTRLLEWARTQFLWAGDPLDVIARSLGGLLATVRGTPTAAPVRQSSGRTRKDLVQASQGEPEDIFDAAEVDSRLARWHSVLEA